MKKLLILALTMGLMVGAASAALASTAYIDLMTGGEVDWGSYEDDLSQCAIGLEIPKDDFKFSGDFAFGSIDFPGDDVDTTRLLLKGGYALINDRQVRLDLTAGYYYRELDWGSGDDSYSSFLVGFDSRFHIDRRAWIDFNYSFGLSPEMDSDFDDEEDVDSLSVWNLKFNYLFTRQFGGTIGYQSEKIDHEYSGKDTYSGLTIGAFYKF